VVRQARLIAVVGAFLIGCAILLVVDGSGVRAEASHEEKQGHTEATKEQEHSGGAAPEEDRCGGTREVLRFQQWFYVTNDVPGCPTSGVLSGTDGSDTPPEGRGLEGGDGDDKIRGLGGSDEIYGSSGSDVVYGGPGRDFLFSEGIYGGGNEWNTDVLYGGDDPDDLYAGNGEDVLYGGDGDDQLYALDIGMGKTAPKDGGRDKLYCGGGWDRYEADPTDYVDSSCEKGTLIDTGGPPLILLAGAVLLLGSGLLVTSRYVLPRASSSYAAL
jgi:hypothetical protein